MMHLRWLYKIFRVLGVYIHHNHLTSTPSVGLMLIGNLEHGRMIQVLMTFSLTENFIVNLACYFTRKLLQMAKVRD